MGRERGGDFLLHRQHSIMVHLSLGMGGVGRGEGISCYIYNIALRFICQWEWMG